LPVCFLPGVMALSLQGFVDHLVMDYFHSAVRRHVSFPSFGKISRRRMSVFLAQPRGFLLIEA